MTIDQYALVALADLKTYIDETTTTYDTVLTNAINAASAIIESYCDRTFVSRDRVEIVHVWDGDRARLRFWPVIQVRVAGYGATNAMTLSYAGTNIETSIAVTSTGTILRTVSSSGTAVNTSTLFTGSTTMAAMATALGAVSGVTATVSAARPSAHLLPQAAASLIGITQYLQVPSILTSVMVADAERGIIRRGRQGTRRRRLPLSSYVGGGDWNGTDATQWSDGDDDWSSPLYVMYTSGYATVPYDIQQACLDLATNIYRTRRYDTGKITGDYRALPDQQEQQEWLASKLSQWRELR